MSNKRAKFFFLVSLSIATSVIASPALGQDWTHTWGGPADDSTASIAKDSNGNLYLAGSTRSFGAGGQDILVLKYDSTGKLLWSKTWGGPGDDYATSVAVDSVGSVYVAGATASFGAGWFDALLLKFDSNGNLLWSKTWGGPSYEVAHDISFDASGNVYVAAETYSFRLAAVLLKFSTNGDLLSIRTWKGPATYDAAYSLDIDRDGSVYLAGMTWDYRFGEKTSILLLKYDSLGNLVWNREWRGTGNDGAWGSKIIRADGLGNIYVAAWTASFGAGDYDVLVLKFDTNGNLIWSRTWGGAGRDFGQGLEFDSSGNIIISGWTNSFPGGVSSALLLKYDPSGNLLTSKIWGGNGDAAANSLVRDAADNIFVAGFAQNNTGTWEDVTGSISSPAGSVTSLLGSTASLSGGLGSPTVTLGTPSGVIDTGGGLNDAFVARTTFQQVVLPPPAIDQITPTSGARGQTITDFTVTGNNFQSASVLSFSGMGITVNSYSSRTATQIVANISISTAAPTGLRDVIVTNPDSQQGVLPDAFTVVPVPPPPPSITSVFPNSGTQGQVISAFTVNGNNFEPASVLSFDGPGVVVTSYSSKTATQIVATIAIANIAALGPRGVIVTNSDGQQALLANAFTVTTGPPPISPPSRPILFVHGWCGNSDGWNALRSQLITSLHRNQAQSYPNTLAYDAYYGGTATVFLLNGERVDIPSDARFFSIRFYDKDGTGDPFDPSTVANISILNKANELFQVVGAITAATHVKDVIVIGHSMGGLVARAYIENMASVDACYDYKRGIPTYDNGLCNPGQSPYAGHVADLITLDTPHGGSQLAEISFPVGSCALRATTTKAEMVPHNVLLESLNYKGATIAGKTPALIPRELLVQSIESYLSDEDHHIGDPLPYPFRCDEPDGPPDTIYHCDDVVSANHQAIRQNLDPSVLTPQFTDLGNPFLSNDPGITQNRDCFAAGIRFLHFVPCVGAQVRTQDQVHDRVIPVIPGQLTAINVEATLDGQPWEGPVLYDVRGPRFTVRGSQVPDAFVDVPTGSYSVSYLSGGPPRVDPPIIGPGVIGPGNWTITFHMDFTSVPGTPIIQK